jgi:hypothetical protein
MARHPGAAFMLVGLLAVDPENRDAINLKAQALTEFGAANQRKQQELLRVERAAFA